MVLSKYPTLGKKRNRKEFDKMKKLDVNFFPGWTRKSVTFTIDDGNVPMDRKFLSIVKPKGILGTFNLNSNRMGDFDAAGYREFYRGYEIANHCKYHPFAIPDDNTMPISDKPFDPETSDPTMLHPINRPGCYQRKQPNGWRMVSDTETYIKYADEGRAELEAIFGKGNVESFVWPYCEQNNKAVIEHLENAGYYGMRKTGSTTDKTGFAMPANRMKWSYNANHRELLAVMEKYESYPDDGELKFFAFGVHSVDWDRDGNWNELEEFAAKYGSRPEDYWYATVRDIFEYEDAVKQLQITETEIFNPTDKTLYIKADGERIVLSPNSSYPI